MAVLPSALDLGRRQAPAPTTTVRGIDDGGVGAAVSGFGNQIANIGNQMLDQEATAGAKERDVYAADGIRALKISYSEQRGSDALNGAKAYEEGLARIEAEATKGLSANASRKLAGSLATRLASARDFAAGHQSTERTNYMADQSEARIVAFQQDALFDFNETENSINAIHEEVFGEWGKGKPLNVIEGEMNRRVSELYAGQIESVISIDPLRAEIYLEDNADDILPSERIRLTALIKPAKEDYLGEGTGNSEYANYIASQAGGSNILDFIGGLEAPGGYDQVFSGSNLAPPKPITTMTIDEVLAWQDASVAAGSDSSAAGRFQIIRETLRGLVTNMKLSGSDLFSQETQNAMATELMREDGLDKFKNGSMSAEQFANNLAGTWAALPRVSGEGVGQSEYADDGLNKSLTTVEELMWAVGGIGDATSPMTPEQIIQNMYDTIPNKRQRDAAIRIFSQRIALDRQETARVKEEGFQTAMDLIWHDGIDPSDMDPALKTALDDAGLWDTINAEYGESLQDTPQYTDQTWLAENYYGLSPDEQLQVPLSELKSHMDYKTWAGESKLRADGMAGGPGRTTNAHIKSALAEFGIDPADVKDDETRARVTAFYESYDRAVADFKATKKHAPSDADKQKIVDEITASTDLYVNVRLGLDKVQPGPAYEVFTTENIQNLSDRMGATPESIVHALEWMEAHKIPATEDGLKEVLVAGEAIEERVVRQPGGSDLFVPSDNRY